MRISRFFGATSREAMRQVRMALGAEALIVSNRRVNGGVEILATDQTSLTEAESRAISAHISGEASATPLPATPAPTGMGLNRSAGMAPGSTAGRPSFGNSQPGPVASAATPSGASNALRGLARASAAPARLLQTPPSASEAGARPQPAAETDVMSALGSMRGALEGRIDELLWGTQLRRAPQAVTLFQALMGFGFSTALLRAMLKHLPENLSDKAAFQWARNELIKHLPVAVDESELWSPGATVALVGPTGVGKTTTVAKLAARCVQRYGADRVVLVTTDTYRIGADDQLKIYGQMMQIPVHVTQDALELSRVLRRLAPSQIVIIDNVGISQRDQYVMEQAAMLARSPRPVSRLLVLNAASHGDTLDEVARKYANDGGSPLQGCIISKVDEASRLGAALDTAIRYKLPIRYVSTGQKVPQDLRVVTAAGLIDQALGQGSSSSPLYVPNEAELAALIATANDAQQEAAAEKVLQRRNRVLPQLLASGPNAAALNMSRLEEASDWIESSTACGHAYDLWRQVALANDSKTVEHDRREWFSQAQSEVLRDGAEVMLAAYDVASLGANSGARLRATVLLDPHGGPLCTPWQQLQRSVAWLDSTGGAGTEARPSHEATRDQALWVRDHSTVLPVVHLLDSTAPALWRSLADDNLPWLAGCGSRTRVFVDECATTVGAVGKTLSHRPIEAQAPRALSLLQGKDARDFSVWVASAQVDLRARNAPALPLQMISVRLVDRHSGNTVKALSGVAHATIPAMQKAESLALWLLIQLEVKVAWRYAAALWQQLDLNKTELPAIDLAAACMQTGLAAWQVHQAPNAQGVREVLQALSGRPKLAGRAIPAGLTRLFALKEML